MNIRPIDIARMLGISTTTLRKYEELGVVPPVARSKSGYRVYTEEHLAYFICAREMMSGFDLAQVVVILREVMAGKINSALWMVNKAQANLHQEKIISEKIVLNLGQAAGKYAKSKSPNTGQRLLTINDMSRETGVPATTIRYWDNIGLISSERCAGNNYRMFTPLHIKQILTVYALKFAFQAKGQKHFISLIKEEMKEFDYNDKDRVLQLGNEIDKYLDRLNRAQISSIAALYRLCIQVEKNCYVNKNPFME